MTALLEEIDMQREIARLSAENARLRALRNAPAARTPGYYETHDPLQFRGRSQVKRLNAPAWPCGCKPYVDVLTAGRWRALGYSIAPGQSAEYHAGKRATVPVFCRCQLAGASTTPASQDPCFDNLDEIPF